MNDTAQAPLTLEMDGDGVAWLVFDTPGRSVNILTRGVLERLDDLLGTLEAGIAEGRVRGVVIRSGKDGSFMAGVDVDEIAGITDLEEGRAKARRGQAIFQRLHRLGAPTVAAIDGLCLGGGTEMALACDVRLASDRPETRIGQPEIRLGIIPGFGGTVRLPRLVGLMEASDLILTGRSVDARKAHRIGLIDERVHPSLLYERARERALQQPESEGPDRGLAKRLLEETPLRRAVLWQAKRRTLAETGGDYPAPLRAIRVMRRTASMELERALELEAEAVGELIVSPISKNLVHVFRLLEGAKKTGPDADPVQVERVGILGAGTMGGGIAQLFAYHDHDVRLKDIDADALKLGLRHARSMFDKAVSRRKLTRREADRKMDRIAPTLDDSGFGMVELVIEAVVERMDVKKEVLAEVETLVGPQTVLTTNTSALSVTELQEALDRPERFCGLHFFNPVHKMPLVEVIRGQDTGDRAMATALAVARTLGKSPVIVRDGPGFLVNRILGPYLNEAGHLLAEGVPVRTVDRALTGFGMPMGPFRLLDEVGLDVAGHVAKLLHDAFGERMVPPPPLAALPGTGRLGRKGGLGFYRYENGKEKEPDAGIYDELGDAVPRRRKQMAPELIRDRCILVMVNEAARILDEGIVDRPGDVDLAMITGTGFPPFRGGLLRYADSAGLATVLRRLDAFRNRHGERFAPAPLLVERARARRGFYD